MAFLSSAILPSLDRRRGVLRNIVNIQPHCDNRATFLEGMFIITVFCVSITHVDYYFLRTWYLHGRFYNYRGRFYNGAILTSSPI